MIVDCTNCWTETSSCKNFFLHDVDMYGCIVLGTPSYEHWATIHNEFGICKTDQQVPVNFILISGGSRKDYFHDELGTEKARNRPIVLAGILEYYYVPSDTVAKKGTGICRIGWQAPYEEVDRVGMFGSRSG